MFFMLREDGGVWGDPVGTTKLNLVIFREMPGACDTWDRMLVNQKHYRTAWWEEDALHVIDQRMLPFKFETLTLKTLKEAAWSIKEMVVRGAGCIGATAGYGMVLAVRECQGDLSRLRQFGEELIQTRPTAVNLAWAVNRQLAVLQEMNPGSWSERSLQEAEQIANEDAEACRAIGSHGLKLIHPKPDGTSFNILTHCNAGWLAFVDYGSATAPIYAAHDAGIPVHVWVDETRPRNQGARLTAWELARHGVPHKVIADNAGGHLMQQGLVDLVITGADRVTRAGDAANKIGTYLKALAAKDNDVPFYIALPSSTFDWSIRDGLREIPIEERSSREVTHLSGVRDGETQEEEFRIFAEHSTAANPAFDVTPARLISGLITERGICPATEPGILELFPEHV